MNSSDPVRLIWRGQEYLHLPGETLGSILKQHEIAPETVIAIRAGEMVDEASILQPGDEIKLIYVISGGMK